MRLHQCYGDLTRSFSEKDWNLPLFSFFRPMKLCFAFDRVNYRRWLPIYNEEYLALSIKFPEIKECSMSGIFAERRATRNGIVVPMDVVLDKADNKPAKEQSGIIGFSRQKAAVCNWKFIMYGKAKYTSHLREWCFIDDIEEYSLHL